MKIAELNLLAFGPFTDQTLDLSAGEEGLHVIHGPNEAGKSSTLRAIRDLLFGIPARTEDNFVHNNSQLRLGGCLVSRRGDLIRFVRRKGNKGTLLDAEGKKAIGDDALDPFLEGVDRRRFEELFGIDYDRLHEGGQEILAEGGEIGKLLFSAGGVAGLKQHEAALQKRLGDLYKTTGRNQEITELLRALREKQKELRDLQLSADVWKSHERNLREAEAGRETIEDELRRSRGERERLVRIRSALESISDWREVVQDLAELDEVPLLPDDFRTSKDTALSDLKVYQDRQRGARRELERIEEELKESAVPEALLNERALIEELQERLGEYQSAMRDRPQREAERAAADDAARDVLRNLGREPDLTQIDGLRIPTPQRARINALAGDYSGLFERVKSTRSTVEDLTRQLGEAEESLKAANRPGDAGDADAVIRRIERQGDLEQQLREIAADVRSRQEQAGVALAQLGLWQGTLEECERLAVPSDETIDRFESEFGDLQSVHGRLAAKRDEVSREIQGLETELDQLERDGAIPTEEELNEARLQRDRGWSLILEQWRRGEADSTSVDEWLEQFPGVDDLAEAYRQCVARADELADRLRREAEQVAKKQELARQRLRLAEQAHSVDEELAANGRQRQAVQEEWQARWQPLGIEPLSPREMRSWRSRQQELVRQADELRQQQTRMSELQGRIASAREDLTGVLSACGVDGIDGETSLEDLLDRGREWIEQTEAAEAEFARLTERRDELRQRLEKTRRDAEAAEKDLKAWRDDWAAAIEPLFRDASDADRRDVRTVEVTQMLEDLKRLFDQCTESRRLSERIEQMNQSATEFEDEVRATASRLAPELADEPAETITRELNHRLQKATGLEAQYGSHVKQKKKIEGELDEATRKIQELQAQLDQLCRVAGCSQPDELEQVWQTFLRRRELEGRRASVEKQLRQLAGGRTVQEFVSEAEQEDPDLLSSRIKELQERIEELDSELDGVRDTIAEERQELKQWGGSDAAAEAAEQCQQTIAALEEKIHEFAVLHVASRVLSVGMEQYRKRNQGPILGRASELFARLTGGSFSELQPDMNDDGKPILTGVRADGKVALPVEAMSDGTHDQLFLALRIASVENWNAHHEPMPFIVDDVLLSFDDDRARAALSVLAELSQSTQVIFFTHHQHLVDLAREAVDDSQWFLHNMNGVGVAV
ncbi:AAA family ATPase [Maioricimonas sp. JC845]|uniref:AAA family ATPase n=1 Tax=Maioricimonas sp. JC845 TaxID=3232138 RepID=UPI0034574DC6